MTESCGAIQVTRGKANQLKKKGVSNLWQNIFLDAFVLNMVKKNGGSEKPLN